MPRKAQTASVADAHAAPGGVAAVDRALSLLAAFQPGDEALPLAQLAERTGLYKSTALRLLASLEHAGLLQRHADGRWGLGPETARLGGLYAESFSLEAVVMPVLHELVRGTGESASYHVRQRHGDEWVRLCLYRVDSPQVLRDHVRPGELLPLARGAGGRVLTAFGLAGDADAPAPSARDARLHERIRRQGYYAAAGDRAPELAGISAPVYLRSGQLAGAITLSMPAQRYDAGHVDAVLQAARVLSGQVG